MKRSSNTVVVRKSTLLVLLGLIVLIPLFFGLSLSSDVSAKTITQQEATPMATPIPPDECVDDPTGSACLALCAANPLQDFCLSAANDCANDSSLDYCQDLCVIDPGRSFCMDLCTSDASLTYCGDLCAGNPEQVFCSDVCDAADPANKPEYCTLVVCQTKPHSKGCDTLCEQDPSQSFCADFCASSDNPKEISFCQNLCLANPNQGFCDRICSEADDPLNIGYCIEVCTTDSNRPYCKGLCDDPGTFETNSEYCKNQCQFFNGNVDGDNQYCLDFCALDPTLSYCTHLCNDSSYKYNFCEAIPCTIQNFDNNPKCQSICDTDPTHALCQQMCSQDMNLYSRDFCETGCKTDPTLPYCSSICKRDIGSQSYVQTKDVKEYCALSCANDPDQPFCEYACKNYPDLCLDTCVSNPKAKGCEGLCEKMPDQPFCRATCEGSTSKSCLATQCYDNPDNRMCDFYCTNSAGAYGFCANVCEENPEHWYCINVCEDDPTQPFCVDACNNTEHPAWYPFCRDICNNIEDPTEYPYCRTLCQSKVNMGAYCADICEKNAYWWCPDTCISNPGNAYCVSQCVANPNLSFCNQTCLRRPELDYCKERCENMEEDGMLYAHCVASCSRNPEGPGCEFMCDNYILRAEKEIEEEAPENGTRSEPVTPIPSYCENYCNDITDLEGVTDVGLSHLKWCGDLCSLRNDGYAPEYCIDVCDRSYSFTGGYHIDALIGYCDDVCFDIQSKPTGDNNYSPYAFCTNVCLNRMVQDGALKAGGELANQTIGKIIEVILDYADYESYTELPYCYVLEDTLPPGFLLEADFTENKNPDWEPYIETRDPCDLHPDALECQYLHVYVDDTTGVGLDCTKNPTLPVCEKNCKDAENPSELNYCYGICNKYPQIPFCDTLCESTANADQISFCVDKCTIPDEPPNWLRYPELFTGELLSQENSASESEYIDPQYADHPNFCNAFICEQYPESKCPAFICSSAANPEDIPSCVSQCAKDASLDFCPDICADNPYGYAFCRESQSCDVNPTQAKCKTQCSNATDPSQLSWCEGLCRQDGSLPFCTDFCENAEDILTPFCTATCKAYPDSGVCDALCELNPANSFCADLCKTNPEKDFCTGLCEIPGNYLDYESICASVCDINPYLNTCGIICGESNTPYDFCQDRCTFVTVDGGSFNTCSNACKNNPSQTFCISACETHDAVFDWCDDICVGDPAFSFCWDRAECYNDYVPYGGIPELCLASCSLYDKLPYCDNLCSLQPDNPWCSDRCEEELALGNDMPRYCYTICQDTAKPEEISFCNGMCEMKDNSPHCGTICNNLADPLSISYCVTKCESSHNFDEYPYCAEKCNEQAAAGLAAADYESFCWDGISNEETCLQPFAKALCKVNPSAPECSQICSCNEETLLQQCAASDSPADSLCCTDFCKNGENIDEPFCGDICEVDSGFDFCALRCFNESERFTPYCGEICKQNDTWDFCEETCDSQYDADVTENYCLAHKGAACCDRLCEEEPGLPYCAPTLSDGCISGLYAPGEVAGCAQLERAICDENRNWVCTDALTATCTSGTCCQDTPKMVPTPNIH